VRGESRASDIPPKRLVNSLLEEFDGLLVAVGGPLPVDDVEEGVDEVGVRRSTSGSDLRKRRI